ncbi:MAG: outer membrane protein assembly factor BamE [Betaproteobacteria bacterium]|jgi:outer membrane protein assembly factor BamE|nr:outer membrane protein assembly factor BamE [Betaproteobacteria bacterium]
MSRIARSAFSASLLGALALLAGCSSLPSISLPSMPSLGAVGDGARGLADRVTPYRIEIVQGNFVSSEQVAALKPGMTRLQVRDLLGSPLLTSVFHGDRWDYAFTIRRTGTEPQRRHLSVFFKGDLLERHEGDAMPSENEFVASLYPRKAAPSVPVLEATEAQLKAAQGNAASAQAAPVAPVAPAAARTSYPPLEPTGR